MKEVKVIWDDAGSFEYEDGKEVWKTVDDIIKVYGEACFLNTSIGYMIWDSDDCIILAQSKGHPKEGDQDTYSNCLRIPRAMILKVIPIV